MISVIVPIYKVEKYLSKCINSIMSQTYRDLEIILVDDGSPDNSGKICDGFASKDKRIKVIHQCNKGVSAARNVGLNFASGDYIGFVDSDDYIEPTMFEEMVHRLELYKADIAICQANIVYEDGNYNNNGKYVGDEEVLDNSQLYLEIFGHLNNAVWNKLYKRQFLSSIRFEEGKTHNEDLLFNLLYLDNCQTGVLFHDSLYNYLQREGSITSFGFSQSCFDEVYSKDKARSIIKNKCPSLKRCADKYCFCSRLNVIRKLCCYDKEKEYNHIYDDYVLYLRKNYCEVKSDLTLKRKLEYFLFCYFKIVYVMLIRINKR